MRSSCDLFDKGNEREVVRIATIIRILVHESRNNKSLLNRLGVKHLLSTVIKMVFEIGEPMPTLVVQKLELGDEETAKAYCVPLCIHQSELPFDDPGRWTLKQEISLREWWEEETIFSLKSLNVTRRMLVLTASEKDGGAHVDDELTPFYKALSSGEHMKLGLTYKSGKELELPFENIHLAAIRQLAFEVFRSIEVNACLKP